MGSPEVGAETLGAKRQVYLVTFPHPRPGSGLVVPSSMSRGALLAKLLQACAAPSSSNQQPMPCCPVVFSHTAVFHERHKEDATGVAHGHYQFAVKGLCNFRFAPVKKALHEQFHLASH